MLTAVSHPATESSASSRHKDREESDESDDHHLVHDTGWLHQSLGADSMRGGDGPNKTRKREHASDPDQWILACEDPEEEE